MDEKKIIKLGKLIAECERGGLLLPEHSKHLLDALPTFTESEVDELVITLQGGITEAKDLEEAGVRFEEVELPKRIKALEGRQERLADGFVEDTLNQLKKETEERMEDLPE